MKKILVLFALLISIQGFCQKGSYTLFGITGPWDGPNCYEIILDHNTDTIGLTKNCEKIFIFPFRVKDSSLFKVHRLDSTSYHYLDSIVKDKVFLATTHYKDPTANDNECPWTVLKALCFKNGKLERTIKIATSEDAFRFLYRVYLACNKLPNSENLKDEMDYLLGREYEHLPEFGKNQAPYFKGGYRIPK